MQVLKVKENKPKLTTFSFKWDLLWLFIFKNFNSLPGKKEETLLEATPQKKFHTYIHWVFFQKKEQKNLLLKTMFFPSPNILWSKIPSLSD